MTFLSIQLKIMQFEFWCRLQDNNVVQRMYDATLHDGDFAYDMESVWWF